MSQKDPADRAAYWQAYYREKQDAIRARKRAQYAAHREQERAKLRARYAANRDAELKRAALYRETHHEQALETTRQWRQKNAAKLHKQRVETYAANPEYFRTKAREYGTQHPDKIRQRNAARDKDLMRDHAKRRRARKRGASVNDLSAAQWREIKEMYGFRCVYCGRKMQQLTQDHLTPLSHGGHHTASNIAPACRSCNSKKQTGTVLTPVQPVLVTIAAKKVKKS